MGIGIGLVGGIAVFDKPGAVFSRGLARRRGLTGFEAADSTMVGWLALSVICDGFTDPL